MVRLWIADPRRFGNPTRVASTIGRVHLSLVPEPAPEVAQVVELAVAADARDDRARVYDSRWRLAGLFEGTAGSADRDDAESRRYALSPRSTRGAMRA